MSSEASPVPPSKRGRAGILVLGDVERSPRMNYHAQSLASHGWHVQVVGYLEEPTSLQSTTRSSTSTKGDGSNGSIQYYPLGRFPSAPPFIPWLALLWLPIKALLQTIGLWFHLVFAVPRCDVWIVQNPPSIPTLFVLHALTFLTGTRVIVDWHNLGYSILALRVNGNLKHPLVRIAEGYERVFGNGHYANLCVTQAMADFLRDGWQLSGPIHVLYDRPPPHFHRLSPEEAHQFMRSMERQFPQIFAAKEPERHRLETLLTVQQQDGTIVFRPDRPRILVTSTSWTPDEDIGLLLEAICRYDLLLGNKNNNKHKKLLVFLTGKGPLRKEYEKKIAGLVLHSTTIHTLWLQLEDYPRLLGVADLGISLHTSSSKLDLPMKVVDMFGCGLPVCAVRYDCIEELVEPGQTGMLFDTSEELASQLRELLVTIGGDPSRKLEEMRARIIRRFREDRWEVGWDRVVLPLVEGSVVE